MAAKYAVIRGTLSADIASPNTDFTSSGFGTVVAAIVVVSNANSTNDPEADAALCVGFWDATNQGCCGSRAEDNDGTTRTFRVIRNNAVADITDSSVIADYSISNITDGVRLTMQNDSTTVARYATVILIGGTASAEQGFVTLAGQDAEVTELLSIDADVIFFLCTGQASESQRTTNTILTFGVVVNDGSLTQRGIAFDSTNSSSFSTVGNHLSTTRVGGQYFTGSWTWAGECTQIQHAPSTQQFKVASRLAHSGSDRMSYLALNLDGDDAWLATLTARTTTGTDNESSPGIGFGALLTAMSYRITAVDTDYTTTGGQMCIGAYDGTNQSCVVASETDNQDTSNAESYSSASNILDLHDFPTDGSHGTTQIAAAAGDIAGGFSLTYGSADGTASLGFALMMGPTESAGGANPKNPMSGIALTGPLQRVVG